jgi:hypothetical protein
MFESAQVMCSCYTVHALKVLVIKIINAQTGRVSEARGNISCLSVNELYYTGLVRNEALHKVGK